MGKRVALIAEGLCIHGPVKVEENAKTGEKIDAKSGEVKPVYSNTGKKLDRYTFVVGSDSVTKDFPEGTQIHVGKKYSFAGEVYLQYPEQFFRGSVVVEMADEKKKGQQ